MFKNQLFFQYLIFIFFLENLILICIFQKNPIVLGVYILYINTQNTCVGASCLKGTVETV